MSDVKRIAILTSGGDAPGMNAAIRAVVRSAIKENISCIGIYRGYNGLINNDMTPLDARSVDGIEVRGGTMLYTARCDEFREEKGLKRAADNCRYMGIDSLVGIGGDGTFRGLLDISKYGVKTVGIPATIDNDIPCTNYTIGFDTAANTAIEAIDKLRDTMRSHERCSIVEVMGHHSGTLALYVGMAVGATAILVPEKEPDMEELFERIRMGRIRGRHHHIIIVAEGVGGSHEIADQIMNATGIDTRVTILGHVQRGGTPSSRDRVSATRMGCAAVDALLAGRTNRVIRKWGGWYDDQDFTEALAMEKVFRSDLYDVAMRMAF